MATLTSVTNHFAKPKEGFITTLSSTIPVAAGTVPLTSTSGLTNGDIFVGIIDPTTSAKQAFTGTVDTAGSQITGVVWTEGTNVGHTVGATIVDYVAATTVGMISKGILMEHSQTGAHTNITQTDTNYIKDTSGNELLKWSSTASAVNEITVKNAATGTDPRISASGSDTNVNLNLRGKGLAKTVTIGAGAATIFPYDYVVSGCVWTADSVGVNRNASMTSGVVVINGNPITVASVTARTFTASKDTYIDVLDNGDGTGLLVYTETTNNAASAALASNSIRIGIIVTGATSIATSGSVNQGQEDRVLPIASSVPYAVTDSLGNLICPRDPNRRIIGYRQATANQSTTSTSVVQLTGLSCPVIVPTGRKVKITGGARTYYVNGATNVTVTIWDGTVGSGTQLSASLSQGNSTIEASPLQIKALSTPSTSSKTYNMGFQSGNVANTATVEAATTYPSFIMVELV